MISFAIALFFILFVNGLKAEPIVLDCPAIYVTNPYDISRIENGQGWEKSGLSGSRLFCRQYINTQEKLICAYRVAAHGASDIYVMKRDQPENAECEKNTARCGFKCHRSSQIQHSIPRLDRKKLERPSN
jgi:hypothetical protein